MKIITGQSLYLLYEARYTKEQCIIESTHTWKNSLFCIASNLGSDQNIVQ